MIVLLAIHFKSFQVVVVSSSINRLEVSNCSGAMVKSNPVVSRTVIVDRSNVFVWEFIKNPVGFYILFFIIWTRDYFVCNNQYFKRVQQYKLKIKKMRATISPNCSQQNSKQPFQIASTNLKRNKRNFQSTAFQSMQSGRTIGRSFANPKYSKNSRILDSYQNIYQSQNNYSFRTEPSVFEKNHSQKYPKNMYFPEQQNISKNTTNPQYSSYSSQNQKLLQLSQLIKNQSLPQSKQASSPQFLPSLSPFNSCDLPIRGDSHVYHKSLPLFCMLTPEQVPKIVTEIYAKARIRGNQPVCYCFGYLKQTDCLYYAIQSKVLFFQAANIFQHLHSIPSPSPYSSQRIPSPEQASKKQYPLLMQQVKNQVLGIYEIKNSNKLFNVSEQEIILAIVHPWEIQFYVWDKGNIVKRQAQAKRGMELPNEDENKGVLRAINFIYKLPVENVRSLESSQDGRIFFFDYQGNLHQITPNIQKKQIKLPFSLPFFRNKSITLPFAVKSSRYLYKNYVNSQPNTFELLDKNNGKFASLLNLGGRVSQLGKYFFPSKIEAISILCNNRSQLLFALLKKTTKYLLDCQTKSYIVCYSISSDKYPKTKLICKFSEQNLLQKFNNFTHHPQQSPLSSFHHSFSASSYRRDGDYKEEMSIQQIFLGDGGLSSDLIIVMKDGVRIYICVNRGTQTDDNIKISNKNQENFYITDVIKPPPTYICDQISNEISNGYGVSARQLDKFTQYNTSSNYGERSNNFVDAMTFRTSYRTKSEYFVEACFNDEYTNKFICALKNDKSQLVGYSTNNSTARKTNLCHPISQAAFKIATVFPYKSKSQIHKICPKPPDCKNPLLSILSSQTLFPPSLYFMQSENQLQAFVGLRPVDVLFAYIGMLAVGKQIMMDWNTTASRFRNFQPFGDKDKFGIHEFMQRKYQIMKNIFLYQYYHTSQTNLNKPISIVSFSQHPITVSQLSSMLLQILIDQQGVYYFGEHLVDIFWDFSQILWNKHNQRQQPSHPNSSHIKTHKVNPNQYFLHLSKAKLSQTHNATNFPQNFLPMCKELLQSLTQQAPYIQQRYEQEQAQKTEHFQQIVNRQDIKVKQVANFKIKTVTKYMSRLLEWVWDVDIKDIGEKNGLGNRLADNFLKWSGDQGENYGVSGSILRKLTYLRKYVEQDIGQLKIVGFINNIIENDKKNNVKQQASYLNKNPLQTSIQQLTHTIIKNMELLKLLIQLPLCIPTGMCTYSTLITSPAHTVHAHIFHSIHQQYRPHIIHQMRKAFPIFVGDDFVRLVMLYDEIEGKGLIKKQVLGVLAAVGFRGFPEYFVQYLGKVHKITKQQLSQYSSDKPRIGTQVSPLIPQLSQDLNLVIPQQLKCLVQKYQRTSTHLSENDQNIILGYFIDNINPSEPVGPLKYKQKQKQANQHREIQRQQDECKFNIANKLSLITYVRNNLPRDCWDTQANQQQGKKFGYSVLRKRIGMLEYVYKCIQIQYEMYSYYIQELKKPQTSECTLISLLNLLKSSKATKVKNLKASSMHTLELLRNTLITQYSQLHALAKASRNLKIISGFYAIFMDADTIPAHLDSSNQANQQQIKTHQKNFQKIVQKICQECPNFPNPKHMHPYMANIALKSGYSPMLLSIVCSITDQQLHQNKSHLNKIKQYLNSPQLSTIPACIQQLQQIFVDAAYEPLKLMEIYKGQMEGLFNGAVQFQMQGLYGLKIMHCVSLGRKYAIRTDRTTAQWDLLIREFGNVLVMQLGNLRENGIIGDRQFVGFKKILDTLLSTDQ